MSLDVYIVTFNCARTHIQPDVFAQYLFDAADLDGHPPGIVILSLQELAPISRAFLGSRWIKSYYDAFRLAVRLASRDVHYVNLLALNLGMTAMMVFVRQDVVASIEAVRTAGVGVGVHGMGNKGAVGVRLAYKCPGNENVEVTFVAAHLAPSEDGVRNRNRDYEDIVRELHFSGTKELKALVEDDAESVPLLLDQTVSSDDFTADEGLYSASSYLFIAGDLNYRTSDKAPESHDPTENFPDSTATDPSDPRHWSHLLAKDQLTAERKAGKTLYGLTEAPITFPPTYKYQQDTSRPVIADVDTTTTKLNQWHWASHRWPSWCDRILYLDLPQTSSSKSQIAIHSYKSLPLFCTSDHRPVALRASLPLKPIDIDGLPESDVRRTSPAGLDPEWRVKYERARRKEYIVGVAAYLVTTGQGLVVLGVMVGAVLLGGWMVSGGGGR